MNNIEFTDKLKDVYKNYKTKYAKGTFGQLNTKGFVNSKAQQYKGWYSANRVKALNSLPSDTRLFDCCGLVKGVLWGFPNIVYTSNGVPDINDQGLYNACLDKSSDFNNIIPGELVWIPGHVGVYLGDGKCIECTTAFDGCVCISSFKDTKGNYRKWTAHGKLPYINYIDNSFYVKVETDWLEVHKDYNVTNVYTDRPLLQIVETRDNYGRLYSGGWIDLTKCRRC